MNPKKKTKVINELVSYFFIMLGALLASFSVICILIPNDAIDYGTAGIAIIISKLTGANLSLCVFLVFLPFLIAGTLMLGKSFGIKAAWGSIIYTVGLEIFEEIPFELNTEHFLAVIFGGAILGLGLAIILRYGGCIDGSEIFANIFVKKLSAKTGKSFSLLTLLIIFNACVYMAVFVLINRNSALLSLLVYVIATAIIDHITGNFEAIKQVTVITKDSEALVKAIKTELHKTCTIIDSHGAIAGDNKTVICYVNYFELSRIKEIIAKTNGAFSIITTIDEIIK